MSTRVTFTCDACGATGEGIPGEYTHPDPPTGWVWFWGSPLKMTGPHACSEKCWRTVGTSADGKLYLPDSHERRAERPARQAMVAVEADLHAGARRERLALEAQRAERSRALVYFIQRGVDGPVKIGFSKAPKVRLASLQIGIPERLRILGVLDGGKPEEQRLHRYFSAHAIGGEWFRPAPEVLAYIRENGRAA